MAGTTYAWQIERVFIKTNLAFWSVTDNFRALLKNLWQ
jgi:hypothetical protein